MQDLISFWESTMLEWWKYINKKIDIDTLLNQVKNTGLFVILFFRKENFSKGVYVKKNAKGLIEVDIYIIVSYGLRITEMLSGVQKTVKYALEKAFNLKLAAVNVYVQGIKRMEGIDK